MTSLTEFVKKFDDFGVWPPKKQVDYIAYYLLAIQGDPVVGVKVISDTAHSLDLKPYNRLPQYLSESTKDKDGAYIRASGGYRLVYARLQEIARDVNNEPIKVAVSTQLTDLVDKVTNPAEQAFLKEVINCYRVEATRAAIIMIWIVTLHHLQSYIYANRLADFNVALAKNPEKKRTKIINFDDFSDIGEAKQIELARSADIISNDVRKLLDEKLGVRNSAAHPSGITFSGHKATEFALDLVGNVLLKY